MSVNTAINIIEHLDASWLNLDRRDVEGLENPFLHRTDLEIERPDLHLLKILRNPKYFGWVCKTILNIEMTPMHTAILQVLWHTPFSLFIGSRGFSKSHSLAILCILKNLFLNGNKIVVCGAAFRQSKVIIDYIESIWSNAPILRSVCGPRDGSHKDPDRYLFKINDSWTVGIPLGTGEKIRGLRAHIVIADEFNSIKTSIYETVIAGFGAVSSNPIQNVKEMAKRQKMIDQGLWSQELEDLHNINHVANQSIIAGTMGYAFEPLAIYWKKYKSIIESKGNYDKLSEIYNGEVPDSISWKDYAIIRVPYELIPKGFMDDKAIAKAKATSSSSIYKSEYGCCPIDDSDGFFKRSLIESCVASDAKPIRFPPPYGDVWFDPLVKGFKELKYVMGVDVASEHDNFCIIILEMHSNHTRIVYCWAINRQGFKERIKSGLCAENDYYSFCVRKMRDLMKVFNVERIGIDAGGGGISILEGLHDDKRMVTGELPIWPIIEESKSKDTDDKAGLHIVEMIQFVNANWTATANHGMRKDLEDKVLLFPRFDSISLSIANEQDAEAFRNGDKHRIYDTLEDCTMEIEELKREMTTIVLMKTPQGNRERWDVPQIVSSHKKSNLRKDRYTALLIANMLARQIHRTDEKPVYTVIGGNATEIIYNPNIKRPLYQGNTWAMDDGVGQGIPHNGPSFDNGGSVFSLF